MAKIRVLVVEDSATIRNRLCDVLGADAEIDVVGAAGDGKQAIELCEALRPDVITLDMMLPVMSGLAATEYIMAHRPTPILVVSSSINRGELFRTYDALAAGAVDVLEKPNGQQSLDEWEARLVRTVKLIARIKVITHLRGKRRTALSAGRTPAEDRSQRSEVRSQAAGSLTSDLRLLTSGSGVWSAVNPTFRVVALGTSTGGPRAIVDILRALPCPYPLPILLVIHIGEPFGTAFADWLDAQTPHHVGYAKQGMPITDAVGRVLLAPPGRHLSICSGALRLSDGPERHFCRPSVDVLFESVAPEYGPDALACLLTGMGADGAAGLLEIRRAGGLTLVQDEASCVVYGMPREAVALGAACRVLPLEGIAATLAAAAPERGTPNGEGGLPTSEFRVPSFR